LRGPRRRPRRLSGFRTRLGLATYSSSSSESSSSSSSSSPSSTSSSSPCHDSSQKRHDICALADRLPAGLPSAVGQAAWRPGLHLTASWSTTAAPLTSASASSPSATASWSSCASVAASTVGSPAPAADSDAIAASSCSSNAESSPSEAAPAPSLSLSSGDAPASVSASLSLSLPGASPRRRLFLLPGGRPRRLPLALGPEVATGGRNCSHCKSFQAALGSAHSRLQLRRHRHDRARASSGAVGLRGLGRVTGVCARSRWVHVTH
jgi:hypothetical protein